MPTEVQWVSTAGEGGARTRRPAYLPSAYSPRSSSASARNAARASVLTTHTWDLAVATGQTPEWDDATAAVGLAAIHGKLPAAGRGQGIPFADAVAVPEHAPVVERLVAWQGRDPRWTPAA